MELMVYYVKWWDHTESQWKLSNDCAHRMGLNHPNEYTDINQAHQVCAVMNKHQNISGDYPYIVVEDKDAQPPPPVKS